MRLFLLVLSLSALAAPLEAQRRATGSRRQPVIERMSPRSGPPGTMVNLVGRNLRGVNFSLHDEPIRVHSCTVNRCVVEMPAVARTGPVVLSVGNEQYRGPIFRVSRASVLTVTSLSATEGSVGDEIRVVGTGFRLGRPRVTFLGRPVAATSVSDREMRLTVPATLGVGAFEITTGGQRVLTPEFHVQAPMRITGFEPRYLPRGGQLTIVGQGFPRERRGLDVRIGRRRLRVRSTSPERIVVQVPRGAAAGEIVVSAGDRRASGTLAQGSPVQLRAISPRAGHPSEDVVIEGSGFGTSPAMVRVLVGDTAVPVLQVQPERIRARLPRRGAGGATQVRVEVAGEPSAQTLPFEWLPALRVQSHRPMEGAVGSELVIVGRGFASERELNEVRIGGVRQTVLEVAANRMRVRVEGGTGAVAVRSGGATAQSPQPFVLRSAPTIASVSPTSASVGSEVTVRGSGFGERAGVVELRLGRTPLEIVSVRGDTIVARIPRGATSGRLRVRVGTQGVAESTVRLAIEARRQFFGMEPTTGFAGVEVVFRGEAFPRQGARIEFAGQVVNATRVSPVELRATVPRRARTGPVRILLPAGRVIEAGVFTVGEAPRGMAAAAVEPECVNPGCAAVIRGHGFRRGARVTFEGQRVEVLSVTATELRIRLPGTPRRGRFEVRVGRNRAETPPFMIIEARGRRARPAR